MIMNADIIKITRLEINPDNGCITALECDKGKILIAGWGCEFGNWHGFFSQDKLGGSNVNIVKKEVSTTHEVAKSVFEIMLPGSHVVFRGLDILQDGRILRNYILEAKEDSTLGDFVIRAAVTSEKWREGRIGNGILRHRSSNTMRQMPVRVAYLSDDEMQIKFELDQIFSTEPLEVLTYLRDEPSGHWIMHHRLLTRDGSCDEYIFRCWHKTWSSYNNRFVQSRFLRKVFWRLAERKLKRFPTLQVVGNVILKKGKQISMTSNVTIERSGATRN